MKITAFYYLAYPDCLPDDPLVAGTEVRVEVALDKGDVDNFDYTYSFMICTPRWLEQYLKTNPFFVERSVIVVERFTDAVIEGALEEILPNIDSWGTKQ